jgi:hypothetical protein
MPGGAEGYADRAVSYEICDGRHQSHCRLMSTSVSTLCFASSGKTGGGQTTTCGRGRAVRNSNAVEIF